MSEKQMSRVAGVPRLKLLVWKAAAAQFFTGKEPSRAEQQNQGKKTKVALLRELAAGDAAVKSWIIKFATDFRARGAREMAAEQGLTMPEALGFVPLFPGDRPEFSVITRSVICMEKPNATELLEKLTTLYPDGDPPEVVEAETKKWADYKAEMAERGDRSKIRYGCNQCGEPSTRVIEISGRPVHFCDRHDGTPTRPQIATVSNPEDPAAYVNADFGKNPQTEAFDPDRPQAGDTPRMAYLKALRRAKLDAAAVVPRGPTYGPTNSHDEK